MKDGNFLKAHNAQHLWHPMGHPGALRKDTPKIISSAEGVRITDIDGKQVIDGVGGLWNVNLGYSCEPVKNAMTAQLASLPYYSAFGGTSNEPAIELSAELAEWLAPEGLTRFFFTSGGSDSVETALRLARQIQRARGAPSRTKFISLKKGYHGTHFGAASVNGNNKFRTAYEPLMPGCYHIPPPWTYRNPWNETDAERLSELSAQALEDEIAFQGASTVAAFIMEPILGAGGLIVPPASFMAKVRDICTRHGVLLIADEVITGFGRTGDWFGSRHWGVKPDMMTLAKAITTAYFPFGAVGISEEAALDLEAADAADGFIGHGYTYSAHPVGAAAAVATLAETKRLDVASNAAARGTQLYEGFLALQEKHELVGDVRGGHGLMAGLELVSDRESKAPAAPSVAFAMQAKAYEAGTFVRVSGNLALFSPPLIISQEDIATILDCVDAGLAAAAQ